MARTLSLIVRNVVFTIVVPGLGGVWAPWRIVTDHGGTVTPATWSAAVVIAAGAALYGWCVWNFAAVGQGTPGPWDAPQRVVATGPYRWVRNPIYIGALLVVLGEAWLFASPWLLAYAAAMAVCCHLFVTGYEERALRRRFDGSYLDYRRAVPRWISRRPQLTGEAGR
ncbi:MAG: isoprenylcysteine carboxylmethyltransferase family protein [Streptosporangiaceae bacterium]